MSGALFDLQFVVIAAFIAAVGYLVYVLVALRRGNRPIDWEKDFPEYRCAKECHVSQIER